MTDHILGESGKRLGKTPVRFGRVRVWYEESPLSLAIALSLACTIFGILWVLMVRPVRPPVTVPNLSLQPIAPKVYGLQDGSAGEETAQEVLQNSQLDRVERESVVLPLTFEEHHQPTTLLAAELESGNIAELFRETALALKEADELLRARRSSARAASKGRSGATATGDQQSARFFGLGAEGARSVVYVIDCSGSMKKLRKLDVAKGELMRSIGGLRPDQSFHIIFFRGRAIPMPGSSLVLAIPEKKQQAFDWMQSIAGEGSTNPVPAIRQALGLRPEVIYVLSDGMFEAAYCVEVRRLNQGLNPATIYTVGFGTREGEKQLKQLARDSGGEYRYVRPVQADE